MTFATTGYGANHSAKREPIVLIVDDADQTAFAEAIRDYGVSAFAIGPDDLDEAILFRSTTVVVDQYLDTWPTRDGGNLPLPLTVPDGLALAAVLRSHVEHSGSREQRPTTAVSFALRTGEIDNLGYGLPRAAREHLLASQYNLEWVFDKKAEALPGERSPAFRVAALAQATASLPARWDPLSGDPGLAWLNLTDSPWFDDARWQVEQCRPPQHEVAGRTAGLAWLRWFMHKILPFPTFLLDRSSVAPMLGIQRAALDDALEGASALRLRLDEVAYSGPLADFLGPRWWRAGLTHLIHQLTEDLSTEESGKPSIPDAVTRLHGSPLATISIADPVVGIDSDYSTRPMALSAAESVRLQPDGWPPYADDPWALRSELVADDADPALLALVVSDDRWRLHDEGEFEPDRGRDIDPSSTKDQELG